MRLMSRALLILLLATSIFAKDIDINFKDLKIEELIKIVANVTNKNILIGAPVKGKVNFISTKKIREDQLFDLLLSILDAQKYTIVDSGDGFLKVVRKNTALSENLPIMSRGNISQLETAIIKLNNIDAKVIATQFKHLLSQYAKIVIMSDSNSLVISDYPKNIRTIKKIIKNISNTSKKNVAFIRIENVKVGKIFNEVNKIAKVIFPLKSDINKVEVIKNDETNSLILLGMTRNIDKLRPYIKQLDKSKDDLTKDIEAAQAAQNIFIIHLNNADAETVSKLVNDIISKEKRDKDALKPHVSAQKELNAIVVVSSSEDYEKIKRIVEMVDIERQQVYVKAKVIEISNDKASKMGIDLLDDSFTIVGTNHESVIFSPTVLSLANSLNINVSNLSIGATLSFLKNRGIADIVSEPSVLGINNQESSIYVGQVQSILTGQSNANSLVAGNNTFTREDIGLTLKVTPRLSQDDKVTLDIYTKLEDILGDNGVGQPTTTKREVTTVAIVPDGDSVIVGGLIRKKHINNQSKIPLLGDIPLIGGLFRFDDSTDENVNLVIIVTPYIVNKSGGLASLKEKLAELNDLQNIYDEDFERYFKDEHNRDKDRSDKRKQRIKMLKKEQAKKLSKKPKKKVSQEVPQSVKFKTLKKHKPVSVVVLGEPDESHEHDSVKNDSSDGYLYTKDSTSVNSGSTSVKVSDSTSSVKTDELSIDASDNNAKVDLLLKDLEEISKEIDVKQKNIANSNDENFENSIDLKIESFVEDN